MKQILDLFKTSIKTGANPRKHSDVKYNKIDGNNKEYAYLINFSIIKICF